MPAQHTASTPPFRGHPSHRHKRKEASDTKPGTVVETTISSHVKDNKRNLQKKTKNDLPCPIDLRNIICYCNK